MRNQIPLLIVMGLGLSALAADAPLQVLNGDFEASRTMEKWGFFSRDKDGSASAAATAHAGKGAARVQYPGDKDWALSNETRFAVQPGQVFAATAMGKGQGTVQLDIVGHKDGKLVTWSMASDSRKLGEQWVKFEAVGQVPADVNQIFVRFIGRGATDAIFDDVALAPAKLPEKIAKPLVQGHATTRVKDRLDRALVALPASKDSKGIYLSWRLLETEGADVAFNVYRQVGEQPAVKLNAQPIARTTDFVDTDAPAGAKYFVRAVVGPAEQAASEPVSPLAQPYVSIKLPEGATFQKIAIADLDGDGKLDYVLKTPNSNVDPYEKYWKKSPGTYKLLAFRHDGTPLWTYDMGWAIEQGIWYAPYVVYDLDGDGKAEVVVKAGDPGDPRDEDGHVTKGNEYVLILEGASGKEITRTAWPSREGFPSYNYYCRNQLGIAYLDGKTPALLVERGTYNTIKLVAYELHDKKLRELWNWNDKEEGPAYRGQGAHCLRAADIDGDGRDEVLIGSAVIDDNGNGLWSTRQGHPDFMTVGDLDPTRPGLEIAYGMETRQKKNGVCMADARTGTILWGLDAASIHIHGQGLCSDIDPTHPGIEIYGGERDEKDKRYLFTAQGKLLSGDKDLGGLAPRAAWWDASHQRRLLRGKQFVDHTGKKVGEPIEGSFVAVVDLLGDWREEVITTLNGELRIYTTNIPAADRRTTLLQDPIYRNDVATASQAYYQMPGITHLPSSK